MKVTISREFYQDAVTMEHKSDDLTLPEVIEILIRPALLALGYQEKSIEEVLGEIDFENCVAHEEE